MYNAEFEQNFLKKAIALKKKYPSFENDLADEVNSLRSNPFQGDSLGGGLQKIRLNIKSKRAGKSGGGRLIIYAVQIEKVLVFISVYDKAEKETEDLEYLKSIAKEYWETRSR